MRHIVATIFNYADMKSITLVILISLFPCVSFSQEGVKKNYTSIEKISEIKLDYDLISDVIEFEILGDKILVLDKPQAKIFVFDRNGNLINSIGNKGRGPGEFVYPSAFAVDDNNDIYVFDRQLIRVSIFEESGNLIETFNTNGINAADIEVFDGKLYLYTPFTIDKIAHVIDIKTQELIKSFGEASTFQKRARVLSNSTTVMGLGRIKDKIYVLSHIYEQNISVFNLEGEAISSFHPQSREFKDHTIPESFDLHQILDDVAGGLKKYLSHATLTFNAFEDKIYMVISDLDQEKYYLEVFDQQGNILNTQEIELEKGKDELKVFKDGIFYSMNLYDESNNLYKIVTYKLN